MILQESLSREREARTILCFLREQMDVVDGTRGRRKTLKERFGLKGMGCCGATLGFRPTAVSVRDNDDNEEEEENDNEDQERQPLETINPTTTTTATQDPPEENNPGPVCSDPDPAPNPPAPSMNLAAALAAERQLRQSNETERSPARDTGITAPGTPMRVSLMRLLEETDGRDATEMSGNRSGSWGGVGNDSVCCVCMGRKKGAAFIPCGHTFCRVCSRELWLNRGACPLCNRPILEILDIF